MFSGLRGALSGPKTIVLKCGRAVGHIRLQFFVLCRLEFA